MLNETQTLIYQTEVENTQVEVRLENGTVWMTQKAIADLYQKSVNTINEHIKNILNSFDEQICSSYFLVIKKEGTRKIKRKIIHYNFDVIFNIALRGQYFEEINKLSHFAKMNGIRKDYITFVPIKEMQFGKILSNSLEGIVKIHPQFRVEKYIVDFYIPEVKLVIEYDEKHHKKQIKEDEVRQKYIEEKLGVQFLRINEGEELKGINRIIKFLMKERIDYEDNI